MLKVGDPAPDFDLEGDPRRLSLAALLERGPVVLYFYPADFTPGCTKEACMFRDVHSELARVGIQVVGISPQSAEEHRKFRGEYNLPFPLLADPDRQVIRQYGCEGPFGLGVRRTTYLIARDGRIADVLRADVHIARHQQFVDRVLNTPEPPA